MVEGDISHCGSLSHGRKSMAQFHLPVNSLIQHAAHKASGGEVTVKEIPIQDQADIVKIGGEWRFMNIFIESPVYRYVIEYSVQKGEYPPCRVLNAIILRVRHCLRIFIRKQRVPQKELDVLYMNMISVIFSPHLIEWQRFAVKFLMLCHKTGPEANL